MNMSELYQEIILDHAKRPMNRGVLEGATRFLWLFPHAKVMGKAA